MFEYTAEVAESAIKMIQLFSADMGGTEILSPLQVAINQISKNAPQTRIFLLTDGDVTDPSSVIKAANTQKDNIRIYTFGIGDGCNKSMVEQVAQNGRGSCNLVADQS